MTITIPDVALRSMWRRLPDIVTEDEARAACLAMLENWPKGGLHFPVGAGEPRKSFTLPAIILPLTEKTDDIR